MGYTYHTMSLLPYGYARGYGYPGTYGHAGYGYPGAYPYGPYGMTAEEIGKIREAERRPSLRPRRSARNSWRLRKRSTRTSSPPRRKSTRTTLLPRRRLLRMPSLRRRSSPRSLAHTLMGHMVLLAHSATAMALAMVAATATATLGMATV